ncbi:hypothetical protein GGS20DRAFT_582448 [Poronia punctata]|nr:hypothetical protein GGS20DRAFT_582448 [Poronia punctata]
MADVAETVNTEYDRFEEMLKSVQRISRKVEDVNQQLINMDHHFQKVHQGSFKGTAWGKEEDDDDDDDEIAIDADVAPPRIRQHSSFLHVERKPQRKNTGQVRGNGSIEISGVELLRFLGKLWGVCPHGKSPADDVILRHHVPPFTQLLALCHSNHLVGKGVDVNQPVFQPRESPQAMATKLSRLFGRPSKSILTDIRELIDVILDENPDNRRTAWWRRSTVAQSGLVSFKQLSVLLTPGTMLVDQGRTGTEEYVVLLTCECLAPGALSSTYRMEYWSYKFIGKGLCRVRGNYNLALYTGKRSFVHLPWRPVFNMLSAEAVDQAVLRGKARLSILDDFSPSDTGDYPVRLYDGSSVEHDVRPGNMIIDPEAYMETYEGKMKASLLHPLCKDCTTPVDPSVFGRDSTEMDILLLPAYIEGYHLASRQWLRVPLSSLQPLPPTPKPASWKLSSDAQVPYLDKRLVSYLVWRENYHKGRDGVADEHKIVYHVTIGFNTNNSSGRGLETAERLAEDYSRPLMTFWPNEIPPQDDFGSMPIICWKVHTVAPIGYQIVLRDCLASFQGILLIIMNRLTDVPHIIKPFTKRFGPPGGPTEHRIREFLRALGDGKSPKPPEGGFGSFCKRACDWFFKIVDDWRPSPGMIKDLVMAADRRAIEEERNMTLNDLITAYGSMTGKKNDWEFLLTDSPGAPSYGKLEPSGRVGSAPSNEASVDQQLTLVPYDGRIPLHSADEFIRSLGWFSSNMLCGPVQAVLGFLKRSDELRIVDWGWPKGRWRRVKGCMYKLHTTNGTRGGEEMTASEKWKTAGFTFGLNRVLEDKATRGVGEPWRRLVLFQGFAELPLYHEDPIEKMRRIFEPRPPVVAVANPSLEDVYWSLWYHFSTKDRITARPFVPVVPSPHFHLEFYEVANGVSPLRWTTAGRTLESENAVELYRPSSDMQVFLKKSKFTLASIPPLEKTERTDHLHWTIVCLASSVFWPLEEAYIFSDSPSLRAQLLCYVAGALQTVVTRWHAVLNTLEAQSDEVDILRDQDKLQEVLFDDDTFSTSKRYFWTITLLHEIDTIIRKNIETWTVYEREVTEYMAAMGFFETWEKKALKSMKEHQEEANRACGDLNRIRQSFQTMLERVTVRRDGLFNASAVMETRASTQLAENVRLLTFVNIFFLPLGLGAALWSINESYSRVAFVVTAVLLTLITFLVTFNLNNLARAVGHFYNPRRHHMVNLMASERDDWWSSLGQRFRAFERPQRGMKRPSEWMVMIFWVWQLFTPLFRPYEGIFRTRSPSDHPAAASQSSEDTGPSIAA